MNNNNLALHHFTVDHLTAPVMLDAAAQAGCAGVCVFVECPDVSGRPMFPKVEPEMVSEFRRLTQSAGVQVTNIEFFPLHGDTSIESYERALATGAELGARLAVTHIHDVEYHRALDTFGRFSELAEQYSLSLGLEFMGLTPGCRTLDRAQAFVVDCGRANVGIGVDALHLYLTGSVAKDLQQLNPEHIAYAQLCDTPVLYEASIVDDPQRYIDLAFSRTMPGEGMIDLDSFVQALPVNTPFDIEVPRAQKEGESATDYVHRAVLASQRLFECSQEIATQ